MAAKKCRRKLDPLDIIKIGRRHGISRDSSKVFGNSSGGADPTVFSKAKPCEVVIGRRLVDC
ncbi:unnamed protein product [Musa acuminata subsp. malaccensis]|uniref:(wild Malaysian banana) hypothetical protein n=1 Tax=Musa acuminata subsp. malaccensis TaxID=214687 RepID=A0A804KFX6_MUSAM|nr:unnamed protein product [Musa acuminata subsp. malaccensis]